MKHENSSVKKQSAKSAAVWRCCKAISGNTIIFASPILPSRFSLAPTVQPEEFFSHEIQLCWKKSFCRVNSSRRCFNEHECSGNKFARLQVDGAQASACHRSSRLL